ncbi:hypothetical protein SAMN05192545_0595 [Maribacter dokdonensis]|uniref:Glycine zipper 2TM domain-containing protein n=1 Tax=Maribacter dokdonensis TaxID=320912 RepID=A0ABY0U3N7_9FLAO|nr:hypothetical protein [Maribacter dokdonensis]SDS00527.1 hypothetical protein SAMN05192545_0595 [Maribacter dokdonensis]
MKTFIYIFLVLSFFYSNAQTSADAAKHLGAGIVIGGVGGYAANKISNGQSGWTWAGAVGSAFAAGITKEAIYDSSRGAEWETRDVVFTTLGGVISALALEVFTGNSGNRRGSYKRGKSCGCLVTYFDSNKVQLPKFVETGTGDIFSEVQAAYLLN